MLVLLLGWTAVRDDSIWSSRAVLAEDKVVELVVAMWESVGLGPGLCRTARLRGWRPSPCSSMWRTWPAPGLGCGGECSHRRMEEEEWSVAFLCSASAALLWVGEAL